MVTKLWFLESLGRTFAFSWVDIGRVVTALIVFGYAGVQDFQTRRIKKWTWYPGIISGLLLLGADLILADSALKLTQIVGLNLAFVAIIICTVWLIPVPQSRSAFKRRLQFETQGLMALGDLKAFATAGILLPTTPLLGPFPLIIPAQGFFTPTILLNAGVTGMSYIGYTVVMNIFRQSKYSSPTAYFSKQRIPVKDARKLDKGYITMAGKSSVPEPLPARLFTDTGHTELERRLSETGIEPARAKKLVSSAQQCQQSTTVTVDFGIPEVGFVAIGFVASVIVGDFVTLALLVV